MYGVPGMEPEDEQKFREIVEKYEMKATIIEEYPAWLIDKMRNNIMNIHPQHDNEHHTGKYDISSM